MFYAHIGTHQGKSVELQVSEKAYKDAASVALLLDGKMIGSIYGTELEQMVQYIVNNDGADLDLLRDGKLMHDERVSS